MIKTIKVTTASSTYGIHLGADALKKLSPEIKNKQIGSSAVIITTNKILKLHGSKVIGILKKTCPDVLVLTIADTEKSKNADTALALIKKITEFDKRKKTFLIALGGGVVGDLTGFIAAIYKRGIPYIQIPTTLLAQLDSSIGGKTAVDTNFGKNLVGAFYQPAFTISDLSLLKTLAKQQILEGLSEGVKYALIKDLKLFSYFEKNYKKLLNNNTVCMTHLVARCAAIKADVVSRDEFDKKNIRIILNFGHTIGHAVEAASNFKISHGRAVGIGMLCAARLSVALKLLKKSEFLRINTLIEKLGLATKIKNIPVESILDAMSYDKKFASKKNRFVLLTGIGKTKIAEDIPREMIRDSILGQAI